MKKMYQLIFVLFTSLSVGAQYHLSGTGYNQNFDDLQLGIPDGWQADTNAKAGSIGGMTAPTTIPGTSTRWSNVSGGFKNVASANGFATYSSATAALQLTATDRALGVRQTGSFGDPGAAYTFQVDNTYGLSDFELELKVQTLDSSSGRSTDWLIQYAIGDTPSSFSTVASYKSGGFKYENKPVAIIFGSVLDDKREKVWIRIVALAASTGGGSRTTTAIDDIVLRWNGSATPGFRPLVQQLYPAKGSRDVPPGSLLSAKFSRNITLGTSGSVEIKNETDHTVQIINAGSSFLSVIGKTLSIAGVRLAPAKTYHVTFDSSIADTASATTYALQDTSEWRFGTASEILPLETEFFDTACDKKNALPRSWSKFSVNGEEQWDCNEYLPGNSSFRMYGNDGTTNTVNEDWLISPLLYAPPSDESAIIFSLHKKYSGIELQLLLSDNYAGSGSPDSASWTIIPIPWGAADVDRWIRYSFLPDLFTTKLFHLGFKYLSTTAAAYEVQIDSFRTTTNTAISNNQLPAGYVKMIDQGNGKIELLIAGIPNGNYEIRLFNTLGQSVSTKKVAVVMPVQRFGFEDLTLLPGLYILSLQWDKQPVVQKFIVR